MKLRLISIRDLAEALQVTGGWVRDKIRRDIIKQDWVIKLPPQAHSSPIRIKGDKLFEAFPDLEVAYNNPDTVIMTEELADILSVSNKTVYLKVKEGTYPIFNLPKYGAKQLIRINRHELLNKFPEYKPFFN